jgi:hypothetical protein
MIDAKEVPTSVQAQYLTALKYATNKTKRLEVLMKEGVNHPDIEDKTMMRKPMKESLDGFMGVISQITNYSATA